MPRLIYFCCYAAETIVETINISLLNEVPVRVLIAKERKQLKGRILSSDNLATVYLFSSFSFWGSLGF